MAVPVQTETLARRKQLAGFVGLETGGKRRFAGLAFDVARLSITL